MALVRCTCLTSLVPEVDGGLTLRVEVADPDCGYVVHRLQAELSEPATPAG
ncbi:hypothetical protein [Nocardioides marmotae]|uniref:hypothetical protein n=1 Tax=Nocardioides marmotae TaxID=2663857 RepID=UPI0012B54AA6|nr:hypothetical protein [Nocardioides marmotae]MBC9732766.1 hypothetical protein [Nocardioides marmotae]MTB83881.1 hypothetical protein [Nocardioides marmotae]